MRIAAEFEGLQPVNFDVSPHDQYVYKSKVCPFEILFLEYHISLSKKAFYTLHQILS